MPATIVARVTTRTRSPRARRQFATAAPASGDAELGGPRMSRLRGTVLRSGLGRRLCRPLAELHIRDGEDAGLVDDDGGRTIFASDCVRRVYADS
jgi:hypothetical protein